FAMGVDRAGHTKSSPSGNDFRVSEALINVRDASPFEDLKPELSVLWIGLSRLERNRDRASPDQSVNTIARLKLDLDIVRERSESEISSSPWAIERASQDQSRDDILNTETVELQV